MISPGRGTQVSATGANAGCCWPRCCSNPRGQLGIGQRLEEFLPHDVVTLRGITVRRPPRFQHCGILAGGNRLLDELLDGVDVRRGLLGRSGAVDEDAAVLLGSVVENPQHHRLPGGGETARLHVEVPVGEHVLHFPAVGDHVGEGFACCLAGGVDEGRRPAVSPGGVLGHAREEAPQAIVLCRGRRAKTGNRQHQGTPRYSRLHGTCPPCNPNGPYIPIGRRGRQGRGRPCGASQSSQSDYLPSIVGSVSAFRPPPSPLLLQHGEHLPHHADGGRPHQDHENAGEDEEDQGEDEFDGGLGGLFFGQLPAADPQRFALYAQAPGRCWSRTCRPGSARRPASGGRKRRSASPNSCRTSGAGTPHLQVEIRQRKFLGRARGACASFRR